MSFLDRAMTEGMEMHPLRPGDPENLGAYVISGRLTEGPRGAAFVGRESDDAPLRVIKLLPSSPDEVGDDVARLTGMQRVSSSHVARTLEAGQHGDQPYVVREYVEGRSLAEVVAEDGPLDGDALERLATGVLTALTAVHLAGITHRGLTPYNVIIGPDGPRVTDADLGEPAGEIGYRAPEQIRGLGYGPYADVFGWASLVVFAATGQPPFGHEADAVLDEEPAIGELADPLRRVVLLALAKDVGGRPTTYTALLQLLGDKRGETALMTQQQPAQPGAPIEGVPVPGLPLQGLPIEGMPPLVGPQAWGSQDPMQSGPMPGPMQGGPMQQGPMQPGPMQGGLMGPLQQGPMQGGPMQGVPLPPAEPVWGPPQDAPQQAWQPVQGQTVSSRKPRRSFPVGLVAAVGALALLSGVGLWGANHYASTQRFEPVAAAVGANPSSGAAGVRGTENGVDQPGQPVQEQPGQGQPEVTVPWAMPSSGSPDDVGPMVLPTDWTSPTPPELSTVPTPVPINTQPVVPTAQPTATQQKTPQPTVTVTRTPTSTPTPTPTQTPTATPTPSQEPTPTPTPTPTVTETVTSTPTPSETKTTAKPTPTKTTAKPTPTKTTAKPTPTPTKTTAKPAPTPTKTTAKPAPTPTTAKPAPTTAKPEPVRNPHTPTAVCGPGFYVQRSQPFAGGETFQLYNTSSGQNCVVTMKTVDVGKATPMTAVLEVQGGGRQVASGSYAYYAGPVKLPAKGKCVRFEGSVGSGRTSAGFANCG
ncbi:serine/threonine protein kinase [Nonomuraea sp. NPDC002799]